MKDITGYDGLYAITSCGKVWSHKRQRFLKPLDDGHGYLFVKLYKDGFGKNFNVHRLVAQAYLDNPENLPCVNHKDENKANNSVSNLEWCTYKYNANYGTCRQRGAQACKKPVHCIELNRDFDSIKAAAQFSKVTPSHVHRCLNGKKKTAGGYHWKYV
jgi:hypothetical protein